MTRSILLKSFLGSIPCLLTFVTGAAAQTAMELNRSGRWAEAAEVALRAATDVDAPLSERCQAFSDLIYANVRLERSAEAAEHLEAFDRTCAEAVAGTWIETETNRLRTEINRPQSEQDLAGPSTRDDWAVADDPADLGLNVEALDSHRALCERSGADACLVVYDGRIVQEWYGSDYREPIEAMSSTKSVTGLLVGMVIEDGKLSEDDGVVHFIPEWTAGAEGGVTVRHLLTMTSGLLGSHVPRPADSHVGGVTNKDSLVFSLPLVTEPGTAWAYSNEGAYLLSPLLRSAIGEPVEDYATRRLFQPLGMHNTRLRVFPDGQAWTHATMWTTPRDLARIGRLMLQHGRWGEEQVVAEAWIEASIQPSQDLEPDYGLLWWLDVPGGFAARGAYDTNVYVLPDRDLVVVRMQAGPEEGAVPYEQTAFGLFERIARE